MSRQSSSLATPDVAGSDEAVRATPPAMAAPAASSASASPLPNGGPLHRLHAALMPDYNRKAAAYWWIMVVIGAGIIVWASAAVLALPLLVQLQIVIGCAIAMMAGLFPVRIPGSKNSFAAGEVFILLLLLLYGPAAAILASAGEAFVGSARTSKRWTSRLASPAMAAVAMGVAGGLLHLAMGWLRVHVPQFEALVLLLAMVFAVGYFLLNTLLVTLVLHLKRNQPIHVGEFFVSFGWVGTTYAASALIAALLYLSFAHIGIGVMAGAVPVIIMLLVMLHYHFRQREAETSAQQVRIAAAEREADQAARHLHALRESEQRFHSAFSHAAIGMALASTSGRVLQVNPALASLLERDEAALVGSEFPSFVHPDDRGVLSQQWLALLGPDEGGTQAELRLVRTDGSDVWVAVSCGYFSDRDASEPCLILQLQDVSARRDAEARLQHMAYHDELTSLANRLHFGSCLAAAIERCRADRRHSFAVMYLDFDRFKLINDTLGHHAGDRFLTQVARRIGEQVRPVDSVGRLGGDEFAILVEGLASDAEAVAMAERLQLALSAPYDLDGNEVNSSASIGITFSSVGYEDPGDVLRDADIAMYRAKAAGRARCAVFDASLRAQLAAQVHLERDLRRTLDSGGLELVYQPIFDLEGSPLDTFEALLRWPHPEQGMVPPATFIPIAEESGLIGRITDWVLEHACAELREMERACRAADGDGSDTPRRRPRLHVNVSGTDMCRGSFVSQVATALLVNGLEPAQLTLEITESMLMKRLDYALETMRKLREIGVGISVDDFGTGYSSLSYLSTLPITSLKIDRSFVQKLQAGAENAEVVKAVLTLGQALGKTVIAEGIETDTQLAHLRTLGCTLGQGWLLARPMDAARATELLRQRPTVSPATTSPAGPAANAGDVAPERPGSVITEESSRPPTQADWVPTLH